LIGEISWRFGETCLVKYDGDLEKRVRRFMMVISYWSLLWSSLVLGDRNEEKTVMETNYGDQNFIHHKVESTYLERFKDRNV
jgi:hypothetical protein